MKRLAAFSHDRRRLVLAIWIGAVVLFGGLAGTVGGDYANDFRLPDSDSQRALDLLETRFPQQAGDSSQLVFAVDRGKVGEGAAAERVQRTLEIVRESKDVVGVSDPFGAGSVSPDGRIAFAQIQFAKQANELDRDAVKELIADARAQSGAGLTVALGGQAIETAQEPEQSATELIGVLVAMVVLFITLGSFVAMGLPLLSALLALAVGMSLVTAATALFDIADFSPQLASMIGIGVGIDYALLLLTRFRAERAGGADVRAATITALDTAGRAVLFAGITVMIALLGMLLLGIGFLWGPAIASALGVGFTMLAAITLMPALLGFFGRRIKAPVQLAAASETSEPTGPWAAWSRFVARRRWPLAIAATAVLLLVASPALHLRLGSSDAGGDEGTTTRVAYDLLAKGFGPGFNGPLLVAVELDERGDTAALTRIETALKDAPGVASVAPAQLNPAQDTATVIAYPATSPQSEKTTQLIERLRADVLPPVEQATRTTASIGGSTAVWIDLGDALQSKLPLFIGVVVALSLLLLMVVFRSVLIPLKAAAMNLLSILAAFGVVTFVFQDGNLTGLLGVDSTGPIEPFLPVMLFAIVFGLSMDYEVFLVTRMHEDWEHTRDAAFSARHGLAMTGKVIAAAGTIMIAVFGAFMLGDDRVIKLFGLGLASAVLLDAFIIRLVLVPAIMQIVGARMWWMPSWLSRRLPRLSIKGPAEPAPQRA